MNERKKKRLETFSRLEALLKEKEITLYRLGKDTNIPSATLSDWKSGTSMPKADKLAKIAAYLGVTIDYLIE